MLLALAACGGDTGRDVFDINDGMGGFAIRSANGICVADQSAIDILQSRATPERLTLTVFAPDSPELALLLGDRPILTATLAGDLSRTASVTFPDARVFWAAFGQADRIEAGSQTQVLADQAALRDQIAACLQEAPS